MNHFSALKVNFRSQCLDRGHLPPWKLLYILKKNNNNCWIFTISSLTLTEMYSNPAQSVETKQPGMSCSHLIRYLAWGPTVLIKVVFHAVVVSEMNKIETQWSPNANVCCQIAEKEMTYDDNECDRESLFVHTHTHTHYLCLTDSHTGRTHTDENKTEINAYSPHSINSISSNPSCN